jgi:Beta-lactamase enzyme family
VKKRRNPLRREQRVYYFKDKHGVLQKKKHTPISIFSSAMATFVLVAGVGFGVNAALNYEPKAKPAYQLDSTSVASAQTESQADKLKSAELVAREDEQLAKDVKSKLRNVPGGQKWSVYVRDLKSDRMASIEADDDFDASGGLSNLFMLAPLEDKIPSANWRYKYGKETVESCARTMIKKNDEYCASAVRQYGNVKNADNVNQRFGFKNTTVNGKKQTTTARETGDLLFRLQNSQVLSDKARRVAFDGLYGHQYREGIPAGCNQDCLVANITNETSEVRSDAAIVTSGKSQYVVVIATEGASWSQIADVSAAIRLVMQP